MDELIKHRSRCKRNGKWFTIALGILLFFVLAIAFLSIGTRISNITKAYVDPDLMENAIIKAQENEEVVELFGNLESVSGMDIARGIVNYSNNDTTIDIYVHIKGSKEQGRMRVFADWNNDKWIYNNISIASKKLKEPIVVIENVN